VITSLLVSSTALAGDGKNDTPTKKAIGPRMEVDDLPGPRPEVSGETDKVDLPAVPAFEIPASEPGFHGARELRVHGESVLGTEIKIKGYVTGIYDCLAAIAAANPQARAAQIRTMVATNPKLCEQSKFYLGDARDSSRDASIWVVDVPWQITTPPPPGERPNASALHLAVGDYVVVTGTWAQHSRHDEHNTGGLVVEKTVARATPPAQAQPAAAAAPPSGEPDIAVVTRPPLRKAVSDQVRNASVDHLNACNKAIAARAFDAGIAECQAATQAWSDNHLAWYAWASAHMAKSEWQSAQRTVARAVALRPDHAMYQLYDGISRYEAEHERVREALAKQDGKRPDEVTADPRQLQLDAARDALRRAIKLGPDLWRAHYYLGRVYRDLDDPRHAAEQFTQTIVTHPRYRYGYIALIELYRKWGYLEEALKIASQGTQIVPPAESAELWFELGMVHDARRDDDQAIAAFDKAIAAKPSDLRSKFQRGQIYFRKRDFANARRDLQEVATSNDPEIAGVRPIATHTLGQILSKRP